MRKNHLRHQNNKNKQLNNTRKSKILNAKNSALQLEK